jgi:hypothetical protein
MELSLEFLTRARFIESNIFRIQIFPGSGKTWFAQKVAYSSSVDMAKREVPSASPTQTRASDALE